MFLNWLYSFGYRYVMPYFTYALYVNYRYSILSNFPSHDIVTIVTNGDCLLRRYFSGHNITEKLRFFYRFQIRKIFCRELRSEPPTFATSSYLNSTNANPLDRPVFLLRPSLYEAKLKNKEMLLLWYGTVPQPCPRETYQELIFSTIRNPEFWIRIQ